MPVRNGLEDFFTQPFPEFYHPFLVTGGTKMSSFARKCQQIFVTAFSTLDPCEAVMQDAAVQVSVNDLLYVGS